MTNRWRIHGVLALVLVIPMLAMARPATAQTALPATQGEIEREIQDAVANGDRVVALAPTTIPVVGLDVPANIDLRGTDGDGDGLPDTILRLPDNNAGYVVTVRGSNATIGRLTVDGGRQPRAEGEEDRAGLAQPVGRNALLRMVCLNCLASDVTVRNAPIDAIEVRQSEDAVVQRSVVHDAGRFGVLVRGASSPSRRVTVSSVEAFNTGGWYLGIPAWLGGPRKGAGAGIAASSVEDLLISAVSVHDTNGDGVAAYADDNARNIRVENSVFSANDNHCVHAGGYRPVLFNNRCSSPRLNGMMVASNHRNDTPGLTDGALIINNVIRDPGGAGVLMRRVDGSTIAAPINGNSVRGGRYSIRIEDSIGVTLARNDAKYPQECHLRVIDSTYRLLTGSNANNFNESHVC